MKHLIALVTGTTSRIGHATARLLTAEGDREVIVTGRSLARIRETTAQLAAETKRQVFTPLELNLNARLAFSPRSPSWSSEVGASIFSCSMPGWSQVRSACSLRRASRRLRPR